MMTLDTLTRGEAMTDLLLLDTLTEAECEAQRILDRARDFPEVARRAEVVQQLACILRGVHVTDRDLHILQQQRAAMRSLATALPL